MALGPPWSAIWLPWITPQRQHTGQFALVRQIDCAEKRASSLQEASFRTLGVRIALYDFLTGYSSLSYLRSFPFDKIKIDKSLVSDLVGRRDNQVIVRDIAAGLGMSVTAEGVETTDQAYYLRKTSCHELQRYLFSIRRQAEELSFPRSKETSN